MDLKLTTRTQEAMAAAVRRAATDGHPQVEPAHLLAALLEQTDGVAPALLAAAGADVGALKTAADRSLAALPNASGSSVSSPGLGRHAYQALSAAGEVARELGDEYVSTEHLLIGLASGGRDAQHGPGAVAGALASAGATRESLLAALPGVRGNGRVTSPDPEGTYNALAKYGNDLTALAREGKLDPVIGRDAEIRRVVQVLSPAHQEQPRAHRRAGRRQDRRRRGPRPADRGRRRPGVTARQAARRSRPRRHGRGGEVPRRVRGAAQGRPRGDQGLRRADRHVHRRAAHRRRRRSDRRGRDGRRQHAQADARPR